MDPCPCLTLRVRYPTGIISRRTPSRSTLSGPGASRRVSPPGIIRKEIAIYSRIILTQNATGQYSFILRAGDGQLLLTSPFYTDKDTAMSRIASTRHLGQRDRNYLVCSTADGQHYFDLRNNKGEILGSSTVYSNRESMEKDLLSLKKCAKGIRVLDLTQPGRAVSSSGKLRSSKVDRRSASTSSGIILTQNVPGQYSFAFRATDGQVLLTSPFFTDKEAALRSLDLMRNLVQIDQLYLMRNADVGEFYFELKNNNGEILGRSPVFSNVESMQKGIELLKRYGSKGKLLDLTGGR